MLQNTVVFNDKSLFPELTSNSIKKKKKVNSETPTIPNGKGKQYDDSSSTHYKGPHKKLD